MMGCWFRLAAWQLVSTPPFVERTYVGRVRMLVMVTVVKHLGLKRNKKRIPS